MRPPSRGKRNRIGHDRWRASRRLKISQRCPQRGLALVNRRGVPTPIGTLSCRSNLQWRGHSRALIHIHHQGAATSDGGYSVPRRGASHFRAGETALRAHRRFGYWREQIGHLCAQGARLMGIYYVSQVAFGQSRVLFYGHGRSCPTQAQDFPAQPIRERDIV